MLRVIPGWVVDDVTSVREEVKQWIGTSPAERWRLAKLCSRDAMWAAGTSDDSRRILDLVDPLPESTVLALRRLRREAGWGDGPD